MAPKATGGVVDNTLVIYGTKNVRVVDASIIPLQYVMLEYEGPTPDSNTNWTDLALPRWQPRMRLPRRLPV